MKTSKLKLTATLLVLFLVGFVSYSMKAYAQPGLGGGFRAEAKANCQEFDKADKRGIENRIPDLTDEQKEKIDKLRTEHLKKMLPLKNELGEKEAQMRTLTTAENVSMSKINSKIEEIGTLKIKMAKEREAHKQEIRKLLNEKQRLIFDTFPPKGKKGFGKHRKGFDGPPRGKR